MERKPSEPVPPVATIVRETSPVLASAITQAKPASEGTPVKPVVQINDHIPSNAPETTVTKLEVDDEPAVDKENIPETPKTSPPKNEKTTPEHSKKYSRDFLLEMQRSPAVSIMPSWISKSLNIIKKEGAPKVRKLCSPCISFL